ncbi:MAG TPA: homoserine kinase [Polyangia bacterium]|nr:homoserine kinase [Polyangia bacterium]
MALLTPLDEPTARALLAEYGLALERLEALPAHGTVNSNFRVRASGRDWFLRVNEGKTDDDVAREAALIERLRSGGLRTPEVKKSTNGRAFLRLGEKPVTLFPWLDAREASPQPSDPSTVRVVGRALAELHRAGRGLDAAALPRDHYTLDELERRLRRFAADARLAGIAPRLAEELARARRRPALPSGLVHQDLFPDNLLVDGAGELVAILDLEQATFGPYVYDLAVAVNAWCWDGERIVRAAADAVLDAYHALRPLEPAERAAFPDEARRAAARFTITRITDVFLADGVDPELRARKDFAEYARRLEFWSRA